MYNDVDMVWLADPFPYLEGKHDIYFMDDMAAVSAEEDANALTFPCIVLIRLMVEKLFFRKNLLRS